MPSFQEIRKSLRRKEPLTEAECLQILECLADMVRPIFKKTTFERLCDIKFGSSSFLEGGERYFSTQEMAESMITFDSSCERGATTEGIFFFAYEEKWIQVGDTIVAPVLGFTRSGVWVRGSTGWTTSVDSKEAIIRRHVRFFGLSTTTLSEISRVGDFKILEVAYILMAVLGNTIMKKKMQLSVLEDIHRQMEEILQTASTIPKALPRT